MPYIKEEHRTRLDPIVEQLQKELANIQLDDENSNIESTISYFILRLLTNIYSIRSADETIDVLGLMECCKMEYFRKVGASINDQDEYDNGDITCPKK